MNANDARAMSEYALKNIREMLIDPSCFCPFDNTNEMTSTLALVGNDIEHMTTCTLINHFGYIRQALLRLKLRVYCKHTRHGSVSADNHYIDIAATEILIEMCTMMIDSLQRG
jgi:hypothetical protein